MRTITAQEVRASLVARREIALLDVRDEAAFATGHPLFAAQLPPARVAVEARERIPRRATTIVLYGERASGAKDRVRDAAERFEALGYSDVRALEDGLDGWRQAGFELFEDVNSYCKAFGELVEVRRSTPSIGPKELAALLDGAGDVALLDVRRPDEFATMSIRKSTNVPGAEVVLRAPAVAARPETLIVVHCAGRTRSIIGTQGLINAGLPNRVVALRNGTIGWVLAGGRLETGRAPAVAAEGDRDEARRRAHDVAYRAGVRTVRRQELEALRADRDRTLYAFDVRSPEEYRAGHPPGFRNAPGGQLVQETDVFAPVRGARIVLADPLGVRADMSASWLAQMGWEVFVLAPGSEGPLVTGGPEPAPPRPAVGRYRRPYEGTEHAEAAMRAYLEWEHGLVAQLARDGTHGFFVI